jgi:anionic cell wall polymer biosynthesis LytR-Cps2A-Psr (LCP) family protein
VEDLFGNIPISGYLAMNMGGIPKMNDSVGGITLEALEDVSFPDAGVDLKEGESVKLDGTQAYYYLHGRDTEEFDSASKRLRREEQYIIAYMEKLKELSQQEDTSAVVALYDEIDDYLVASVDFTSLIEELVGYDFSEDAMYTVPGETVLGEPIDGTSYEEYHVDEEALEALIMQIFYEPVD